MFKESHRADLGKKAADDRSEDNHHEAFLEALKLTVMKDRRGVKPGWVLLPKFDGNGFRKNLTALPRRGGRGSVRGWRDKNAFLGYRRLLGTQCRLRRYVTWLLLGILLRLHKLNSAPGTARPTPGGPPHPTPNRIVGRRLPTRTHRHEPVIPEVR
jgi:hypothetical protein